METGYRHFYIFFFFFGGGGGGGQDVYTSEMGQEYKPF